MPHMKRGLVAVSWDGLVMRREPQCHPATAIRCGAGAEPINPSTTMKLSDLIKTVGDENIGVQNLLNSSPGITCGKRDGKISFSTEKTKAQDLMNQAIGRGGEWTALVVWIPKNMIAGAEQAGSQAPDDSTAKPHNARGAGAIDENQPT